MLGAVLKMLYVFPCLILSTFNFFMPNLETMKVRIKGAKRFSMIFIFKPAQPGFCYCLLNPKSVSYASPLLSTTFPVDLSCC